MSTTPATRPSADALDRVEITVPRHLVRDLRGEAAVCLAGESEDLSIFAQRAHSGEADALQLVRASLAIITDLSAVLDELGWVEEIASPMVDATIGARRGVIEHLAEYVEADGWDDDDPTAHPEDRAAARRKIDLVRLLAEGAA